jgi:isopentenyl-diphosphate delta-isomerase type 1
MVFLLNSRTQIFLQRRSRRDAWYPSYWTASCSGHVKSGETYQSAAIRELKEELGLHSNPVELFKFLMPKLKYREFIEWEYMCVIEMCSDEPITLNLDEIEEGKFVAVQELKNMISNNLLSFTPDLVLALEKYTKVRNY